MSSPRKNLIFVLILGLLVIGVLYFFLNTSNPQKKLEKIKDQTQQMPDKNGENTTPEENVPDRAVLLRNCAKDIPVEKIDDMSFDPQKKTVKVYWSDDTTSNNVSLTLPYEPESGFAGCSESAKEILRRVQQTQS